MSEAGGAVKSGFNIMAKLPMILTGLAITVVLIVVFALLKKFHIIGTTEADKIQDKQEAKNATDAAALDTEVALQLTGSPLDGVRFPSAKEFSNQYHFSTKQVGDFGKQIYDAKGIFKDDEASAIAVAANMPSKYTFKVMAYYFNQSYKKDLLEYLKTFMNAEQLAAFDRAIAAKPDFIDFLPATKDFMKKNKIKNYVLK